MTMTTIQCDNESSSNKAQLPLGSGVDSKDQVSCLPPHLVSNDPKRPLKHSDTDGTSYHYALKPLWYSVIFILLIEMLERFAYYGINNSQTAYLMGIYNPDWNANMTATSATTFVSATQGIAYSLPFLGGILADGFLGDYWGILLGTSLLYIPGLLLIALTSYPYIMGPTFDYNTLVAGMLVLYPLGAGFIKSVVNVFGAKQYHPTLQQPMIERYYINFYMVINIGALVGGLLIPILAEFNVAIAYTIPVCALTLGLIVFVLGSSRYVRHQPNKEALWKTLQLLCNRTAKCQPMENAKKKNGGALENSFVDGVKQLLYVAPITALTIPFNIAYNQMTTVFVIQGSAMAKAHVIDASTMTNIDPLSVLIFGTLVGSGLYPFLSKRGIHIPITYKFAIGTFFGALSILSAIAVDYAIHNQYMAKGKQISILWSTFNYLLIGAGEIFAITSAYDATFSIAPKEQKGLASAINLFLIGGLPNFICIALYNSCEQWFPSGSGSALTLEDYSQSQLYLYLWVLFGICIAGTIINLLPPVKNWVENIHQACIKNAMMMDHQQASSIPTGTSSSTNHDDDDDDDVCSQADKDVEGQSSIKDDENVDESMETIQL